MCAAIQPAWWGWVASFTGQCYSQDLAGGWVLQPHKGGWWPPGPAVLPQTGVLEAKQLAPPGPTGLPGPESVPSPAGPLGWQIPGGPGLTLKLGSGLLYSHLSHGSLSPHRLPDSRGPGEAPCFQGRRTGGLTV